MIVLWYLHFLVTETLIQKKHALERHETLVLRSVLGNKALVHSAWPGAVPGLHPGKPPS